MKVLVVVLAPFLLCSGVVSLVYQDCGSIKGRVNTVAVSGCENQPVCPLRKGTSASITVGFQSETDTKSAKAVVHGIIGGVPLPFPLPQPDGCKNCGLSCPLQNGKTYDYSTEIDIRNSYPSISLKVKWQLQDDNGDDLFCILVPAEIS